MDLLRDMYGRPEEPSKEARWVRSCINGAMYVAINTPKRIEAGRLSYTLYALYLRTRPPYRPSETPSGRPSPLCLNRKKVRSQMSPLALRRGFGGGGGGGIRCRGGGPGVGGGRYILPWFRRSSHSSPPACLLLIRSLRTRSLKVFGGSSVLPRLTHSHSFSTTSPTSTSTISNSLKTQAASTGLARIPARRPLLYTTANLASSQQQRDHGGHSHGHHHHHDNTYLVSKNKADAGVRITRLGLYTNIAMALSKGIGGWYFNSQALVRVNSHPREREARFKLS